MTISEPQAFILESSKSINLFLSGIGAGKTFLAGILSYDFIKNFPQCYGFIGANTYSQLNTSTLKRIREVWATFGLKEGIHYVVGIKPPKHYTNIETHNFENYNDIITFLNGAIIFKGSLDNYKAHDGKEFAWAILDETKDTKEEAVKEVIIGRLRQSGIEFNGKQINPLYITTSPAKVDWINEWFRLDDFITEIESSLTHETYFAKEYDDKCVVISSTHHNSDNLPPDYIDKVISNNTKERAKALIYGNPFTKIGGEFYSSFDRSKHVKPCLFNKDLPLHISFDQNVVPYITMVVAQYEILEHKNYLRYIDEICLSSPKNNTPALCHEFMRRYPEVSGLFFYGDPAGKHRDTRGTDNDYTIIERELRRYLNNNSNKVPYKHPPVIKRRDFVNMIFEEKTDVIIEIDPKCVNLIKDFEYLKEDENGKKLKQRVKDEMTGQSYEKYGHTSDAQDYLITSLLEYQFDRFML